MYDVIETLVQKYGVGKIRYQMLDSALYKITADVLYVSECTVHREDDYEAEISRILKKYTHRKASWYFFNRNVNTVTFNEGG